MERELEYRQIRARWVEFYVCAKWVLIIYVEALFLDGMTCVTAMPTIIGTPHLSLRLNTRPRPIARLPSRKIIFGALVHMWISGRDGITLPSWPESDAAVVLSHNRATRLRELGPIDRLRPPHYYSHLTHAPKPASYLPAALIRWRSLVRHFVAFSNFFLHYFLQVRYPPQSPCGVAAHALSKRG